MATKRKPKMDDDIEITVLAEPEDEKPGVIVVFASDVIFTSVYPTGAVNVVVLRQDKIEDEGRPQTLTGNVLRAARKLWERGEGKYYVAGKLK